jgi:hypothetical protein
MVRFVFFGQSSLKIGITLIRFFERLRKGIKDKKLLQASLCPFFQPLLKKRLDNIQKKIRLSPQTSLRKLAEV